jgi:multimeric flavodoxin WrbA
MKAIGIVCSPRKDGNSEVLVREVLTAAGDDAAKVLHPNEMKIRGCQGCYACKEKGSCVMEDDMKELYREIKEADAVVFGTPIYMYGVASQFKVVLDRLFAFLGPAPDFKSSLPKGKRAVLVVSQGYEDAQEYGAHIAQMKESLRIVGFDEVKTLVAPGLNELGEAAKQPSLIQRAQMLGRALCSA